MKWSTIPSRFPAGALLVCATMIALTGCHRSYYRRQADIDAELLVAEKASDQRWNLPEFNVNPDPRSRMYHPFSEDHPPMPPDDPTAHQLMEYVDGKPGYPHWEANGLTAYVANPEWLEYLNFEEDGSVTVSMADAVELSRIHSRDYQTQVEELYLSALDVSLERFNFETQLFAGYNTDFTSDGRVRGGGSSSSLLNANTGARGIRLEKLGTVGSTIVVGFANSMLWQFAGPNDHTPNTLIDFSIVQPLLRGAGRDRIMESLTATERALLANVRQMERYRRGFALEITTGRSAGTGPSRGSAQISSSSTASTNAGGYIGLLQAQQDIRIQESNVASLRNILAQFEAFAEADRVDFLQVQQSQSALYDAQSRLMQVRNNYESTLDNFKISLGLPPQLKLNIQDSFLDQFQLIDASMTQRQNDLALLQGETGDVIVKLIDARVDLLNRRFTEDGRAVNQRPLRGLRWNDRVVGLLEEVKGKLVEAQAQCEEIRSISLPRAERDVEKLQEASVARRQGLAALRRLLLEGSQNVDRYDIEAEILSEDQLLATPGQSRAIIADIESRLEATELAIAQLQASIDRIEELGPTLDPITLYAVLDTEVFTKVPTQLTELSGLFLELTLQQVVIRTESIVLVPIELSAEQAVEIARQRRRDWMNARTALVDRWRNIEFVADQLESDFGLVFEGDIGNVGDNPLRLRDVNGRLRAGFQFDSPITRLTERNSYREALINYHRTRRSYYAYEDEISRSLRQTLRTLEQNRLNFELARRSVKVAVQQVDLAGSRLSRPPQPGSTNAQLGATTARDLVSALSQLQNNQSSFLQVWVGYEVLRRSLDFDLGTMEVDENGMWLDPGPITDETVSRWLEEGLGGEPDPLLDFGQFRELPLDDMSAEEIYYDESGNPIDIELPRDYLEPIPADESEIRPAPPMLLEDPSARSAVPLRAPGSAPRGEGTPARPIGSGVRPLDDDPLDGWQRRGASRTRPPRDTEVRPASYSARENSPQRTPSASSAARRLPSGTTSAARPLTSRLNTARPGDVAGGADEPCVDCEVTPASAPPARVELPTDGRSTRR
ncbi:MAG: TolC family protein [Pirellulaceae bacterium]